MEKVKKKGSNASEDTTLKENYLSLKKCEISEADEQIKREKKSEMNIKQKVGERNRIKKENVEAKR